MRAQTMYPFTFRTKNTETVTTSSNYGSFYAQQSRPFFPIPDELTGLFDYVDCNNEPFIENLREFVRIRNVSGEFENRHEMTKGIELVKEWFKRLNIKFESFDIGWCEMSNACCKLPNVLLGKNVDGYSRRKKTILIYCHLDIRAPETDEWRTDPFDVVDENKCLYGKGVAYGKGSLVCWLHAILIYKERGLELPVNVKFIVESMHESNNAGLEKFLNSKKSNFLNDISYVVLNESEWLGTKIPCIVYGTIGMCKFDITSEKCKDSNPKEDMEKVFEYIVDEEENILIPKFNENVIQITPEEEKLYDLIHYDFEAIRSTLPPHKQNWDKLRFLMSFWRLPSIYVGPIEKCDCDIEDKNKYMRKFAVKIVPLQLPDDVGSRILKYVFDVCEEINCHSVVNVEMVSGTRPWLEDFQTPNYEAARRAMLMVYREAPNMIREDKEIPTILLLQRVLDKSILLLPLAAEKSNANKPNENITKKQFFEGTKVLVAYLSQLAVV